ncbi:Dipeptidyl aminopeptidase 4 [termite gut metagenome]|uniref:Dipeptidyl aminopeptidase 4 n=1 Tax=termite gut metagenome TaxID=433724 RepID=A0A5J4RG73_9ZZZZ
MKKIVHIAGCVCLLFFSSIAQAGKPLDLKEIVSGKFRSESIPSIIPTNDGESYTQMNGAGTQIIQYSFKTGKQTAILFDVKTARECPFKKLDGYTFSPDGGRILIRTGTQKIYRHSYSAVHYVYTIERNLVEKLSERGPQQAPVFSPNGEMIAFVRNNNIFLVKWLYNRSESQVTEDGKPNEVFNGIPDWVYEEEFGFDRALEFSPDSKMLAYIRFDESEVPSYSIQLFRGQSPGLGKFESYPGWNTYKYPKAGEANSKVSVHTFDIRTTVTRKMDLPLEAGGYIPRIRFTQDAEKLAILILNRHQNRLELYFANPKSTLCRLIVREENPYYINENVFDNIRFYPDNFSLLSERDGYAHLYWYTLRGTLVKQVTSGNFEVRNFLGWDAESETFYYESNEESPLHSAVYKVDKKGKKTKLSQHRGTNTAIFGPTMKYYINTYSALQVPAVVTVNDHNGHELKTLVDNHKLEQTLKEYDLPTKEFFTFTTSQGTGLNGWMMKPADFDASIRYPVLMYLYGGPESQRVVDRWNIAGEGGGGVGWEAYMTSKGYVVVCVDGRGTGGRGREFTKCVYLNVGIKESQDQVEAANYLSKQAYVDENRIGIWGWSFGGYLTIMSMSEGTPVFKAGAAVAPVTDWKYYDAIYTERLMRMPKENAEGYKMASAFTHAKNLNGKLLLVHGTADDNVHFQNTVEYSEQLVQTGKQFDMQIYTNRDHGITGGNTKLHLFTKLTEFFTQNL